MSSAWAGRRIFGGRGFTLVELLVVISVIGLLLAILMPAVHAAREAGRRTQCANNLHQLSLAAGNFHSAHGCFPMARPQPDSQAAQPEAPGVAWGHLAQLLPYLGQSVMFNRIDFTKPFDDPANAEAQTAPIPVFRCPSDTTVLDCCTDPQARPGWKKNNYRGNGGNNTGALDSSGVENNNGVFIAGRKVSLDQMLDGPGCTALFSEHILGDGDNNAISNPGDWFAVSPASQSQQDVYQAALAVTPATGASAQYSFAGPTYLSGGYTASRYNHILPPNQASVVVPSGRGDLGYDIDHGAQATTASSRHPGGVNVAFADGAVRFIANKINLYPWQAMGSIAGQERVVDEY